MIHGCAGTAFNWWPQSASCNNCRGMPEQMSHTIQALARGYAGEASALAGSAVHAAPLRVRAGCWCCVASYLAVAVTGGNLCWLALLLLMLQWTRCCWLLPPPMCSSSLASHPHPTKAAVSLHFSCAAEPSLPVA